MGNCKYCGKPAGFFRDKHAECDEQFKQREQVVQRGHQQIVIEVLRAVRGSENFDTLEKTIAGIQESSFVPPADRKALLIAGWEKSVEQFLEDGILDNQRGKKAYGVQKALWFVAGRSGQEWCANKNHKGRCIA